MLFKQSGYKPHTLSGASQASSASSSSAGSPPKSGNGNGSDRSSFETTGPAVCMGAAGRHRYNEEMKFAGLNGVKRGSIDESRPHYADYADQKRGSPGMLQGMWNTFTRGT